MDVIVGSVVIPVLILPECAVGEHVDWFNEIDLDRCPNCGSSLFRNYNEKGEDDEWWVQQICAVCNFRLGDFKKRC